MVKAKAVAQNMRSHGLAAIIFDLGILLEGLLGSQQVGAGTERIRATSKTGRIRANGEADRGCGIEHAAVLRCISDAVTELGIAEPNLMRECSGVEIQSGGMHRRVVDICERLKTIRNETFGAVILLVRKAIERVNVLREVPI